jgi:hypothetical protein
MRDDKRDRFVDDLLESSLKRYHSEEPRSGLEMRILASIQARDRAARRRTLGWAVAACAGMLAALVVTLHFVRAPIRQPTPKATLRVQQSGASRAPLQGAKPPAMVSQLPSGSRLRGSSGLVQGPKEKPRTPKPRVRATQRSEQFPTPYPLTEQEKLLLAYLEKARKPDSVARTNQIDGEPVRDLEIPEIKIAALGIKPLDDSQSEQEK